MPLTFILHSTKAELRTGRCTRTHRNKSKGVAQLEVALTLFGEPFIWTEVATKLGTGTAIFSAGIRI